MTDKAVDELLNDLTEKDLYSLKKFILEKRQHYNDVGRAFFDYIIEYRTKYIIKKDRFIFTNGTSVYYINKEFSNEFEDSMFKIYRDTEKFANLLKLLPKEMNTQSFKTIQSKIEENKEYFVDSTYKSVIDRQTVSIINVEYISTKCFSTRIKHNFSKKEIELAENILMKKNFDIDIKYPLATLKSNIGKCYILGKK